MRVLFLIVVCHALDADTASVRIGPRGWLQQHNSLLDEARALQQESNLDEGHASAAAAEPLVTWCVSTPALIPPAL